MEVLCQKLDLGVVDTEPWIHEDHKQEELAPEKQYFLLHLPNG